MLYGPKPPAKRKAFKRWTVDTDGDIQYSHGGREKWLFLDSLANSKGLQKVIVDALNAARVALPTGRKAKP
jgi:hypothetical protein